MPADTDTATPDPSVGAPVPRWIDGHCHLDADPDVAAEQLAAAREVGVARAITVGTDLESSRRAITDARAHDGLWATVGLHPHEARLGLDGLEELLDDPTVVAVGECGLDYHYDHSPRATQREVFAAQIAWAHAHDLPLMIHTREAWEDTFAILDAEGTPARTVVHCFTGGPDEARGSLDRGALLSFSGIVSFKKATDVQEAAKLCPLDRLLVETDSPYLAPMPHRGKLNRPAWVPHVGEAVAALKGLTAAEVAASTWDLAERFYGLGALPHPAAPAPARDPDGGARP
ncbi:MAG: TatD family hydrolase [Actinomycetota bacterium]|nr:TatD family hydrolase [Actinomycetota bacterium]